MQLNFIHLDDSLAYIQARALATVVLCHSSDPAMVDMGYNAACTLYNSCLRLRLLSEELPLNAFQTVQHLEQAWTEWRLRESRRRTGLFIGVCKTTIMIKSPLAHMNSSSWTALSHCRHNYLRSFGPGSVPCGCRAQMNCGTRKLTRSGQAYKTQGQDPL